MTALFDDVDTMLESFNQEGFWQNNVNQHPPKKEEDSSWNNYHHRIKGNSMNNVIREGVNYGNRPLQYDSVGGDRIWNNSTDWNRHNNNNNNNNNTVPTKVSPIEPHYSMSPTSTDKPNRPNVYKRQSVKRSNIHPQQNYQNSRKINIPSRNRYYYQKNNEHSKSYSDQINEPLKRSSQRKLRRIVSSGDLQTNVRIYRNSNNNKVSSFVKKVNGFQPSHLHKSVGEKSKRPHHFSVKTPESSNYNTDLTNKQKYKVFVKELKSLKSFDNIEVYAKQAIEKNLVPTSLHWKICMIVAELARRDNKFDESRRWFDRATKMNPTEGQIWLEYARLEEECGRLNTCEDILLKGLQNCQLFENLYIKLVKYYEQLNMIDKARGILGRLKYFAGGNIFKVYKVILEGAVLESRCGNVSIAQNFFQWLMRFCPNYGPIYHEAYKLEEKCGNIETALQIVERGLECVPKHAPLWFAALHLYEKAGRIDIVREKVKMAVKSVTKEIVWKIYCESARIEEHGGSIKNSRNQYVMAVKYASESLRWKIWLAGSRTELNNDNFAVARELLNRALTEVPQKNRYIVLLEFAKLEEWVGNYKEARRYIEKAKREEKHEWKVFLEAILLEMRAGNIEKAIEVAEKALEIHNGTGRLWSIYIRLQHIRGEDKQYELFKRALQIVPKSGEVWCEGARLRLNPLSSKFDLDKAKKYLNFAIKFTPQYGDSFIEYLRAELLTKGPILKDDDDIKHIEQLCINADPNYGPLWFYAKNRNHKGPVSTVTILKRAKSLLMFELYKCAEVYERALLKKSVEFQDNPQNFKEYVKNNKNEEKYLTALHSYCNFHFPSKDEKRSVLYESIFGDSLKM